MCSKGIWNTSTDSDAVLRRQHPGFLAIPWPVHIFRFRPQLTNCRTIKPTKQTKKDIRALHNIVTDACEESKACLHFERAAFPPPPRQACLYARSAGALLLIFCGFSDTFSRTSPGSNMPSFWFQITFLRFTELVQSTATDMKFAQTPPSGPLGRLKCTRQDGPSAEQYWNPYVFDPGLLNTNTAQEAT